MDTKPPPLGESRSNTGRLAWATSTTEILGTQQERRRKLVYRDAAIVATKDVAQDEHSKIIHKTVISQNKKQHAVGCEYIHMEVNGSELTVYRPAGVHRGVHIEFISAYNREPPWSTRVYICTVRTIEHHDVVSSGILADESPDKRPCEWMKQSIITVMEATEAYMVEVTAEFHS